MDTLMQMHVGNGHWTAVGKAVATTAVLTTLFGGCATMQDNPKAAIGGLGGAAGGGLIAAAAGGGGAAIAAGVIVGGLLGGAVGGLLDANDRKIAAETTSRALESSRAGTTSAWKNPDSGNSGTVTPVRTFQEAGGAYCREYRQTVTIGGKQEQSYGTACRQPDGSWRIAN